MDIKEVKKLLRQYSKFLEEYGYTDSDWREEKPTAIGRFLSEDNRSFLPDVEVKPEIIEITMEDYEKLGDTFIDAKDDSPLTQWRIIAGMLSAIGFKIVKKTPPTN